MQMAFVPAPYVVYVTVAPTKRNGITKPHTARVGAAGSIKEAQELIADDKKAMGETFGGLIEAPGTTGRAYSIFKANWQAVALATV
jgi:hypothetical protein